MRIQNNMMAMNTQRSLSLSSNQGAKSMAKLSSGFRINSASDDAAGLSISEKMRAQVRGLNQAGRNAQDGISLIQTAEGALGESQAILQRMRELAVQAGNDTNTTADRGEIQKEINQLTSEINRIGNTTEFNTQKLLNGGSALVGSVTQGAVQAYGAPPGSGAIGTVTGTLGDPADSGIQGTTSFTITTALVSGQSISVGGETITVYDDAAAMGADSFGIALDTAGTAELQATAIRAMTFTGITTAGTGAIVTLNQTVNGTGDVTEATAVSGVGAGAIGSITGTPGVAADPGTQGNTSFTITTPLAVGDTFDVAGETITVYADATALAAANSGAGDAFGISFADAGTADLQAAAIRTMTFADRTTGGTDGTVTITQDTNGTGDVTDASTVTGSGTATAASTTFTLTNALAEGETLTVAGITFVATADGSTGAGSGNFAISAGISAADQAAEIVASINVHVDAYDATGTGAEITITQATAADETIAAAVVSTTAGDGFTATLQIGSNQGQLFSVSIGDMRAVKLGVAGATGANAIGAGTVAVAGSTFAGTGTDALTDNSGSSEYALDVSSAEKASAAIAVIDQAVETVSGERSKLGSMQNRLEHTIKNLDTSAENMQSAESRIRDVDMAKEMMEFTKSNILQQAATAMLAQANQAPQAVLQLLR